MKVNLVSNNFILNNVNSVQRSSISSLLSCDVLEIKNKQVSFSGFGDRKRLRNEAQEYVKTAHSLKNEANSVISYSDAVKQRSDVMVRISENVKRAEENAFWYYKKVLDNPESCMSEYSSNTFEKIVDEVTGEQKVIEYKDGKIQTIVEERNGKIVVSNIRKSQKADVCIFDCNGKIQTYYADYHSTNDGETAEIKISYQNGIIETAACEYFKLGDDEKAKAHYIFDNGQIRTSYIEYKKQNKKQSEISADECFVFGNQFIKKYFSKYSLLSNETEISAREFDFSKDVFEPRLTTYKEHCCKQNGKIFGKYIYKYKKGKLANLSIRQHLTPAKNIEKSEYFIFDENEKPKLYLSNCGGLTDEHFEYWDKCVNLSGLF